MLAGRKRDALRKQTVEAVFGIIKSIMGFRQFSMRGLAAAQSEWESRLPVIKFEAYGRIVSAVRKTPRKGATFSLKMRFLAQKLGDQEKIPSFFSLSPIGC